MKKIICIFIITIMLIYNVTVSAENKTELIYFGIDSCSECIASKIHIDKLIEKYGDSIKLKHIKINNKNNEKLFLSYVNYFNIKSKVPLVVIGDEYFNRLEDIQNKLEGTIENTIKNNIKTIELQKLDEDKEKEFRKDYMKGVSIVTILVSGLIDGVNPCALAMLIFMLSFIMSTKTQNKNIIGIGITYASATFITYFLIGIGLIEIVYKIRNLDKILYIIYGVTAMLCIMLFIMTFIDYLNIKKDRYDKVKMQLPKGIKHKIHNQIRKRVNIKTIYMSTFITGFIVSLLEFLCTGQMYIPTLAYMISLRESSTITYVYLIMYNIAFIIPIIITVTSLYIGKELIDTSQLLVSRIKDIKLITSIFYLAITIYMIIQLLKIMG